MRSGLKNDELTQVFLSIMIITRCRRPTQQNALTHRVFAPSSPLPSTTVANGDVATEESAAVSFERVHVYDPIFEV